MFLEFSWDHLEEILTQGRVGKGLPSSAHRPPRGQDRKRGAPDSHRGLSCLNTLERTSGVSGWPVKGQMFDIYRASQVAWVVKNPLVNAGDARDEVSVPRSGRSPGEGIDNPLQYSHLENPMDRGAWCASLWGRKELDMTERLNTHTHTHTHLVYTEATKCYAPEEGGRWTPTRVSRWGSCSMGRNYKMSIAGQKREEAGLPQLPIGLLAGIHLG